VAKQPAMGIIVGGGPAPGINGVISAAVIEASDLGYGAGRYLLRGGTGSMSVMYEGRLMPVPFVETIDPSTGKVKVRTVDVASETYTVGRKYMIRLEKEDFSPRRLRRLAGAASLTMSEFTDRFGYLSDTLY
jgi:6-phosphofructokinase